MSLTSLIQIIFFLLVLGIALFFGQKIIEKFIPGPSWVRQLIYALVGLFLLALGVQFFFGIQVLPFTPHAVVITK